MNALAWAWSSSVVMAQFCGPEFLVNAGLLYMCQRQSNLHAFSTNPSSVVGCGDTPIIFWCRARGNAFLKANICVSSFAPDLECYAQDRCMV